MRQTTLGLLDDRENPPAPPEDQIKGSDQNEPGSASEPNADIELGASVESMIEERMAEHNDEYGDDPAKKATEGQLKSVARRAMGAYSTSHREGVSRQAWASGRIDAYLHLLAEGEPESDNYVQDNDLLPPEHKKSTRENPAKWTDDLTRARHTPRTAMRSDVEELSVDAPPSSASETQRLGTGSTYAKIGCDIRELPEFNIRSGQVLDFGGGKGHGTDLLEGMALSVDLYEPFPDDPVRAPDFKDVSEIPSDHYDVVVSSSVLNVIPQDERDAAVEKMFDALAEGGTMYVTVRADVSDVDRLENSTTAKKIGDSEFVTAGGTYQYGFSAGELRRYLRDLAPEGVEVVRFDAGGRGAKVVPEGRENPDKNFHVAKVEGAQGGYQQYRRDDDTTFGRGVHALYGIREEEGPRGGKTDLVSLHYPAAEWNAANARRHAEGLEDFSIRTFHEARGDTDRSNPPDIERLEVKCSDLVLTDSTNYDEDYSTEKEYEVPKAAQEAAQQALEWKKQGADGMHETGMRRTLQLAQGCSLSRAEMEDIRDWFAKKEHEKQYHEITDGEPSASLVSWKGWGGDKMKEKADTITATPTTQPRENAMKYPGMEAFSDMKDSLDGKERENPEPNVYETAEAARQRAQELGLDGIHSHMQDGTKIYMPGKTHEAYNMAIRKNPPSGTKTKDEYPGIFEDYDGDEIPTADDPNPLSAGDTERIEEVGLADEMEKILDVQQEYDDVRRATASDLKAEGLGKVQSRTKTPYSIINKLRRKRIGGDKGITDVAGTRLIVPDYDALEQATGMIDDGELGTVIEKENHYESEGNPYSAVHYIVRRGGKPVEIQIITERVKKIAGAAHTPYKEGNLNADRQRELTQMATRADKGDAAAARTLKPILEDEEALEDELTQRSNPIGSGSRTGALLALAGAIGFKYITS